VGNSERYRCFALDLEKSGRIVIDFVNDSRAMIERIRFEVDGTVRVADRAFAKHLVCINDERPLTFHTVIATFRMAVASVSSNDFPPPIGSPRESGASLSNIWQIC
jgi:hypothetical protein